MVARNYVTAPCQVLASFVWLWQLKHTLIVGHCLFHAHTIWHRHDKVQTFTACRDVGSHHAMLLRFFIHSREDFTRMLFGVVEVEHNQARRHCIRIAAVTIGVVCIPKEYLQLCL